jgi:type IV fimbrial biogenesis protein FimT
MARPATIRRARGFTLTEALVTVAILGILGAFAAPGISRLVDGQRVRGASSDLFTALLHARSEAVRRNTEVTLTPVTPGRWEDGWTIPDPADTAVFFLRHEAVPKAVIEGPDSVVYLGNGRVKGSDAPSFDISDGGEHQRCIRVDLSGRPTQSKEACES